MLKHVARLIFSAGICACPLLAAPSEIVIPRPLTVEAALETTRFMPDSGTRHEVSTHPAISLSPDGKRFVVRLVHGDVQRNGVWLDVVSGHLDSLDAASQPEVVCRLFTTGTGRGFKDDQLSHDTTSSEIKWIGNDRIAFLFSDARHVRQVWQVNLVTHELNQLTHHADSVYGFDVASNGAVLYVASAPLEDPSASSRQLMKQGFVVPENTDAMSLLRRDLSGISPRDRFARSAWFVQDRTDVPARSIAIGGQDAMFYKFNVIRFSPDGRLALVNARPKTVPDHWDRYVDLDLRRVIAAARNGENLGRHLQQLMVLDVRKGVSRPLWDAPSIAYQVRAEWSADGRFILLAPAFFPADNSSASSLKGQAATVAEVATGRYVQLPVKFSANDVALRWTGADEVEIGWREGEIQMRSRFSKVGGQWQAKARDFESLLENVAPIRLQLRSDLNTPPRLFAIDTATGEERKILDPNPRLLTDFSLGRAEKVEGGVAGGGRWKGVLFYPVNYLPGRRYPLVIQSTYSSYDEIGQGFSLNGDSSIGLGPAIRASYPGQVLANRGIAVLHLDLRSVPSKFNTPLEGEVRKQTFEDAVEQLVATGVVDRKKVGLLGFSRNGWYVEYTLTHSNFPFAAALTADSWDPGYFQAALTGNLTAAAEVIGAQPFAEGLDAWLKKTSGFNAEKIRAPLRKVAQSDAFFTVLAGWELYSRLRALKKPVEFYVMPDADENGDHNTQNPEQIRAVQQGSVDWFDFWLNEYEDSDEKKKAQYLRWRAMRELPMQQAAGYRSNEQ